MITLKSVSCSYQSKPVIHNFSCHVRENRITAIIGPNGAGKSTLLKLMGNIMQPEHGKVLLEGKPVNRIKPGIFSRQLSFLMQNPLLPEGHTVEQLVMLGRYPYLGLWGKPSKQDWQAVRKAIEQVGLEDMMQRPLVRMSGGQLQRAWIAMAIAQDTPWILLDEPTSFLDLSHQLSLLDLLVSLRNQHQKSIVMVIHDLNLASYYAEELIVIKDGRFVAQGLTHEILDTQLLRNVFNVSMQTVECDRMNLRTFIPENPVFPRMVRQKTENPVFSTNTVSAI